MLSYCEICGVLLPGSGERSAPEGVICDTCFASRQVLLSESSEEVAVAPPPPDGRVQFECVYCRSLLRLPAVEARTSVRCPQCAEQFYLCPDGRVEARLGYSPGWRPVYGTGDFAFQRAE